MRSIILISLFFYGLFDTTHAHLFPGLSENDDDYSQGLGFLQSLKEHFYPASTNNQDDNDISTDNNEILSNGYSDNETSKTTTSLNSEFIDKNKGEETMAYELNTAQTSELDNTIPKNLISTNVVTGLADEYSPDISYTIDDVNTEANDSEPALQWFESQENIELENKLSPYNIDAFANTNDNAYSEEIKETSYNILDIKPDISSSSSPFNFVSGSNAYELENPINEESKGNKQTFNALSELQKPLTQYLQKYLLKPIDRNQNKNLNKNVSFTSTASTEGAKVVTELPESMNTISVDVTTPSDVKKPMHDKDLSSLEDATEGQFMNFDRKILYDVNDMPDINLKNSMNAQSDTINVPYEQKTRNHKHHKHSPNSVSNSDDQNSNSNVQLLNIADEAVSKSHQKHLFNTPMDVENLDVIPINSNILQIKNLKPTYNTETEFKANVLKEPVQNVIEYNKYKLNNDILVSNEQKPHNKIENTVSNSNNDLQGWQTHKENTDSKPDKDNVLKELGISDHITHKHQHNAEVPNSMAKDQVTNIPFTTNNVLDLIENKDLKQNNVIFGNFNTNANNNIERLHDSTNNYTPLIPPVKLNKNDDEEWPDLYSKREFHDSTNNNDPLIPPVKLNKNDDEEWPDLYSKREFHDSTNNNAPLIPPVKLNKNDDEEWPDLYSKREFHDSTNNNAPLIPPVKLNKNDDEEWPDLYSKREFHDSTNNYAPLIPPVKLNKNDDEEWPDLYSKRNQISRDHTSNSRRSLGLTQCKENSLKVMPIKNSSDKNVDCLNETDDILSTLKFDIDYNNVLQNMELNKNKNDELKKTAADYDGDDMVTILESLIKKLHKPVYQINAYKPASNIKILPHSNVIKIKNNGNNNGITIHKKSNDPFHSQTNSFTDFFEENQDKIEEPMYKHYIFDNNNEIQSMMSYPASYVVKINNPFDNNEDGSLSSNYISTPVVDKSYDWNNINLDNFITNTNLNYDLKNEDLNINAKPKWENLNKDIFDSKEVLTNLNEDVLVKTNEVTDENILQMIMNSEGIKENGIYKTNHADKNFVKGITNQISENQIMHPENNEIFENSEETLLNFNNEDGILGSNNAEINIVNEKINEMYSGNKNQLTDAEINNSIENFEISDNFNDEKIEKVEFQLDYLKNPASNNQLIDGDLREVKENSDISDNFDDDAENAYFNDNEENNSLKVTENNNLLMDEDLREIIEDSEELLHSLNNNYNGGSYKTVINDNWNINQGNHDSKNLFMDQEIQKIIGSPEDKSQLTINEEDFFETNNNIGKNVKGKINEKYSDNGNQILDAEMSDILESSHEVLHNMINEDNLEDIDFDKNFDIDKFLDLDAENNHNHNDDSYISQKNIDSSGAIVKLAPHLNSLGDIDSKIKAQSLVGNDVFEDNYNVIDNSELNADLITETDLSNHKSKLSTFNGEYQQAEAKIQDTAMNSGLEIDLKEINNVVYHIINSKVNGNSLKSQKDVNLKTIHDDVHKTIDSGLLKTEFNTEDYVEEQLYHQILDKVIAGVLKEMLIEDINTNGAIKTSNNIETVTTFASDVSLNNDEYDFGEVKRIKVPVKNSDIDVVNIDISKDKMLTERKPFNTKLRITVEA